MKIKTPKGEIYDLDDCEKYEDDSCEYNTRIILNAEKQKDLAEELFKNTGILTG